MSKRIDQLTSASDAQVTLDTSLLAVGDPATGQLYKGTVAQAKLAFATQTTKYTATGSEGTTITIAGLLGKDIISIAREGSIMYEVASSPDSVEFIWNGTDITLGLAVQFAGERFLILYKNV